MTGSRRHVARVAWIPVVTTLGALLLSFGFVTATDQGTETFRSELVLLVPATPPTVDPLTPTNPAEDQSTTTVFDPLGRPTEALRAASNYANVIPQDAEVRAAVAAAARLPVGDVDGRITATAVPDSSLIVVTFDAPSAEASEAGVAALEQAVTGDVLVTRTIPPGSLIVVSRAEPAISGGGSERVLISAAVLGLAFGVFLAFAWARSNARVYRPDDLAEVLDSPILEVNGFGIERLEGATRALKVSMAQDANSDGERGGGRIALVAVDDESVDAARRFSELVSQKPKASSASNPSLPPFDGQVVVSSRAPQSGRAAEDQAQITVSFVGRSGSGEATAAVLDTDGVVLAVQLGRPASAVRKAVADTVRLGRNVNAVLLFGQDDAAPTVELAGRVVWSTETPS